jgi:hypothetical protein
MSSGCFCASNSTTAQANMMATMASSIYRLRGTQSRVALTYGGNKIATVESGMAFDPAEWEGVRRSIEHSLLAGVPKIGRDLSSSVLLDQ